MRRGFLLPTPHERRKTALPTTSPAPSPSRSTKVIPLPAKYIPPPLPPIFPPDLFQRTVHIAQVPEGGTPEQLTVFIHYNNVVEALRSKYRGWPQSFSTPSPTVYKVVPIKGAGLGLVATSDIVAGAVILRERPLVLVPRAYNMRSMNEGTRTLVSGERREHHAPREPTAVLRAEERGGGQDGGVGGGGHPRHERIHVRCSQWEVWRGGERRLAREPQVRPCRLFGVLPNLTQPAIYSCRPNAEHCFDTATLTQSLRAFRDIPAGEEITVTYIDWSLKCEERQDRLRCRYSFNCTCKSCQLTGLERMESDLLREFVGANSDPDMIVELDTAFARWLAEGAPQQHLALGSLTLTSKSAVALDPLNVTLLLWNGMATEGCYAPALWEPVLTRLVQAYAVFEDEERVRYYSTKAAELRTLYTESDGGWLAVAANPRLTEWWGKLGTKRKV